MPIDDPKQGVMSFDIMSIMVADNFRAHGFPVRCTSTLLAPFASDEESSVSAGIAPGTILLDVGSDEQLSNRDNSGSKLPSSSVRGSAENRRNFVKPSRWRLLPNVPRPRMSLCILAGANEVARAIQIELERPTRTQKLVKKLAKKYNTFFASKVPIRQILHLLGPGVCKVPHPVSHAEDKANEVRLATKFQMKKMLCFGVAVGHVMTNGQVLCQRHA
ncbi:hypothetical protein BKA70DRAFT_1220033 [Coprinopsis sp. MPI-PUGE-AT-0042]|nr:hypothetical protein BKA70DRAFT_1220033 [Coprinopsis sp. MPI-PUGE-AT-0042]